jgi:hypothetical protein
MSDSFMTPDYIYDAIESVYGRPILDPCWHPKSPVRPRYAYCLHLVPGDYQHRGVTVTVIGRDGLVAMGWTAYASLGWFWLNPPYSDPALWLRKLDLYPRSVSLLKSDHTTGWFDGFITRQDPATTRPGLFRDRLHYPDADEVTDPSSALFPSILIVKGMDHTKIPLRRIMWLDKWSCV